MKSIDVYFEDRFVANYVCDKIIPNFETNLWFVYENELLVGSIPMNYLIRKIN